MYLYLVFDFSRHYVSTRCLSTQKYYSPAGSKSKHS